MPTNKVAIGAGAGALMAILAWAANAFWKVQVPAEIALAGSTLITFIVQYMVPDSEKAA